MNTQRVIPENWKFFSNIQKTDTCWIWMGGTGGGYGRIRRNGKSILVHRYSYEIFKETIKANMVIHHTCHNHLCVNPDHLEQMTKTEHSKLLGR